MYAAVSLAEARRTLAAEEAAEAENGAVSQHEVSASMFLVLGFELEDQQ